jgi:CspA family cold shock protein
VRTGTVSAFDAHAGLGEVTADDATVYPFHCVEIVDGSRTIAVDTPVTFRLFAKLGVVEAGEVTPGHP